MPFCNHYMAKSQKAELTFLESHYTHSKKLFSSDQHIMFVNAVEDYGLENHER